MNILLNSLIGTATLHSRALQNKPISCVSQIRTRYQYLRNRSRVKRDIVRHDVVPEAELDRMVLKALHRDQRLDMKSRLQAMLQLHQMPHYTLANALKPRCVETGRGNGLVKGFRMSRIAFRENAINGRIPGVTRAVW